MVTDMKSSWLLPSITMVHISGSKNWGKVIVQRYKYGREMAPWKVGKNLPGGGKLGWSKTRMGAHDDTCLPGKRASACTSKMLSVSSSSLSSSSPSSPSTVVRTSESFLPTSHVAFSGDSIDKACRRSSSNRNVSSNSSNRGEENGRKRRLIIMRHADGDLEGTSRDHDRRITPTGAEKARSVAIQLENLGWIPEVVIASNATRSRETLEELRRQMVGLEDADAHYLGSLYTVSQLDGQCQAHIASVVSAEARINHDCVLCLGHNKGWEEAASGFGNTAVKLNNCDAALLESNADSWEEAFQEDSTWVLVDVIRPRIG